MLFGKKKRASDKGGDKAKDPKEVSIKLDSLETESVAEQLKEIEAKKAKQAKQGKS